MCGVDIIIPRADKIRFLQIGIMKFTSLEIGAGKIRFCQVDVYKIRLPDFTLDEFAAPHRQIAEIA